ncbi:MAG TPA: phospholipase D-like domain-containing protein [Thermoanaerobaculia bacterium]|jgi:phosphatidylserine/phosphatidylglycerophosphate/cardiolipin synthase-like enzyme
MRVATTQNGLTLRVIAGTTNIILGIDLAENRRQGCLGFSIQRVDLGPAAAPFAAAQQVSRWLPNLLRFPSDKDDSAITTERAPLQKFRWGDYTTAPAHRYRYRVVPRYGAPGKLTPDLTDDAGLAVEVTTEDNQAPGTAVFFNRAAAASQAFEDHFPQITTEDQLLGDTPLGQQARKWLSRGLEEALLAYLAQAKDGTFALHAVVYEFQKPNLLAGLKAAIDRGAEVKVVYHHRQTQLHGAPNPADKTADKNAAAAHAAGLDAVCVQRSADPQGAIMHNKFVVLLKKTGNDFVPQAVWTGSTNWTDGGIYGQLNVGHAVYDADIAATYEANFQLLHADPKAADQKKALAKLTPVPTPLPSTHRAWAIFSPQANLDMIHLYAKICSDATTLMVCAPFELHQEIRKSFLARPQGALHFLLLDQKKSLGSDEEVQVQQGDPRNTISVATTLSSALHDFQGKLLEGKESFLHAGIHIHSKIILADPFGSDPILVTGSANYSTNSTTSNDSNTLLFRGDTAVTDIYATEFMRMFEHYHFRASEAAAQAAAKKAGQPTDPEPLNLKESDAWTTPYYVSGSLDELDRRTFAGTVG